MAHADMVEVEGKVLEPRANGFFLVRIEQGAEVLAHLGGKLRQNYIRVITGDRVTLELSPYDLTRGRIIFRHRS